MAYLNDDDISARVGGEQEFIHLCDDDGDGAADPNVIERVTTDIDSIVDGFARRGGYTTPLVAADAASINYVMLDIANYTLRTRGNRVCSEDDRLKYENAWEILKAIGDGKWEFPSGPAVEELTADEFGLDSEEQLFTRTTLDVL